MNRPLTRPQERKLRNRHGQLTAYAFSLGAVERRHGAALAADSSGRYRVAFASRVWFFDSLLEARKFMPSAAMYTAALEDRKRFRA